jgi:parvulin-like peptidyl-prolyl isomerase
MNYRRCAFLLLFLLNCHDSFSQTKEHPRQSNLSTFRDDDKSLSYVAKAGDMFISEREFARRFEMLPGFERHQRSQLEYYKAEFLYALIAEKLLAQEAVVRNFDRDTVFQLALLTIKKKLARDELYKEEIIDKVTITDLEIIRGIARAQTLLLSSYLYFPKEQDAQFVRGLMKKSADFETLKIDSSISFLRDTATVIWGDADPNLEEAVYRLKKGEISPVIKTEVGFFIAKVTGSTGNSSFTALSSETQKERVVETIQLRKQRERLDEYVGEVLKNKTGYSVPKTFKYFAQAFEKAYDKKTVEANGLFCDEILGKVRKSCAGSLYDSLTVVGHSVWTLGEVISKLTNKTIRFDFADSVRLPDILNTQIKVLVQQELLEQEALRRGLDQVPSVKEKLEIWRTALLASLMKEYVRTSIVVTDGEIYSLMEKNETKTNLPQVQIRILKTSSLEDMNSAMNEVMNGMPFADAVHRWSIDTLTKAQDGLTNYFPINERPPFGEIAERMEKGETYGPIIHEGGYVFFRLEGKRKSGIADTMFSTQYLKAKTNLVNMRQKQILNLLLAQSGEERGFAVYEEALKQIKVTPIPMMTFRILGFGGRMFEVPFVDPQIDWLNIDPPKTKVLP